MLIIEFKETDIKVCPHCKNQNIYFREGASCWECLKCNGWFQIRIDDKLMKE